MVCLVAICNGRWVLSNRFVEKCSNASYQRLLQYWQSPRRCDNERTFPAELKQIAHSKKITIHTIQSNNLLQIAKALRLLAKRKELIPIKPTTNNKKIADLISQEFLTPLEETRLAIEEVVIAKNIPIDLIPRTSRIRKQQHELVTHYQLKGVSVGKEQNRRIRILPN